MVWSNYLYLAVAALAAVALVAVYVRLMPQLKAPSATRTRAELTVLALTTILGLVIIYWNFYISKSYYAYGIGDVGSDTFEQYVPFYVNIIDKVRDGSLSVWNFEFELGVSYASYQSWLLDPFNLIVVPLGLLLGDAKISLALVIAQSVKVALCVFLFDHFLTRYCETPLARVLGALLYGFSGYMIMYGQHYFLGSMFPVFTLIMLLFELYLEKATVPRFLGLALSCAVVIGWSAYVAFMVLLFAALYLLLRIPHKLDELTPKTYVLAVLKMCLPVLCGLLLSGAALIPYAYFLLKESARTSSDTSLAQRVVDHMGFVNLDWIPAILSRTVGTGLINTGSASVTNLVSDSPDIGFAGSFPYEFIMLGYSGVCFVLLSQFFHWTFTETKKRDKVLVSLATVLVLLYCFHQLLPTIFTAMVRLQYRSSYAIAVPACAAMALGFEKRVMPARLHWPSAIVAAAATLAVLVWSLLNTVTGRLVCLYYLAATAFTFAMLVAMGRSEKAGQLLLTLFVGAAVSMSIVDGFFDTNSRGIVAGESFPLSGLNDNGVDTTAALEYLEENDASFYRLDKTYSTWCPLNDSFIQHFAGASAYNSTPDADVDEFYNKLWKEAISTWAVYSQGFKNAPGAPEVAQLLGIKYVLSQEPLDFDWLELENQFGSTYLYRNTLVDSIATIRQNVVSQSEADALETAADRRTLLTDSVIVPDEVASELAGTLSGKAASSSSSFEKLDDDHIQGTVTCEAISVVCLPIPNTDTWEITVDGVEVETFKADYGFIGFTVDAGTHEVKATYHLAGLGVGGAMSAAGAALAAASAVAIGRRRRSLELA